MFLNLLCSRAFTDTNDWQLGTGAGMLPQASIQAKSVLSCIMLFNEANATCVAPFDSFNKIIATEASSGVGMIVLDHELSVPIANMWIAKCVHLRIVASRFQLRTDSTRLPPSLVIQLLRPPSKTSYLPIFARVRPSCIDHLQIVTLKHSKLQKMKRTLGPKVTRRFILISLRGSRVPPWWAI